MIDRKSNSSGRAQLHAQTALGLAVHELFEAWVSRDPNAVAVIEGDRRLSYGELNALANQLARQLLEIGVRHDERVAVLLPRSVDLVVALLAILKSGGAYLPLDHTHPSQRTIETLRDGAPLVVLTRRSLWQRVGGNSKGEAAFVLDRGQVIDLSSPNGGWRSNSGQNIAREIVTISASDLAYVIYTSGSAGTPKGVGNTHSGLKNRLEWFVESIVSMAPVTALKTSVGFVDSVTEILQTLLAGGRLVVFDANVARDPGAFAKQVALHRVNTLVLVPSFLIQLLEVPAADFDSIDLVICSGERLGDELSLRFLTAFPSVRLFNFYGSSEVNGDATAFRCGSEAKSRVGASIIGRPIANLHAYVLDENRAWLPMGQKGELYIGGVGLARGYLNQPELTAERFVADPFSGELGARMYKTGDLGRYLPDGNIEFLGRADHQVKIRGFRIELGEIEARLSACEGVREVVVLAREDEPGEKRLVAYYTARATATEPARTSRKTGLTADVLREQLAAQLPEYMVPAAFVALPALPLTPNGKVDRKALPAPDAQAFASKEYEAPVGKIEKALAGIWSDVLGLERVGRRDNFFDLGGHSLLAVRVAARVHQRLGVEIELGELFNKPELSALARAVQDAARSELPPIAPTARDQPLNLSFAQQRLWFLAQMEGVSQAYHIPMGLRLEGVLNRQALERALQRILARHEALRTTFKTVDGEPTQHIEPPDIGFALQHHDLCGRADASDELRRLTEQEATQGFDLESGPLIRGRLIQLGETQHVLLITLHHIVSDGWSMEVLTQELTALYGAFSQGGEDPLPALPIQYADYAAWQRRWLSGAVLQTQSQYWQRTLAGAPELLELPTDRPRPQRQDHAGAVVEFGFDETLSAGLKALGQRHGATIFMTLLAAWGVVLTRLSGQAEVVVGTPVANRRRSELEPLIGFFVNTLALRLDSSGGPSVAQWLERTKAQVVGAQQHQDMPFEQVVELMRPVRSLAHGPLFQVMFAWQGQATPLPELPGLTLQAIEPAQDMAKFDLTLTLRERGGRIEGEMSYATALFERETVQRHVEYLRCIAKAMLADEAQAIDRLDILPAAERHKLLVEWNDTKVEYPDQSCVHELFEAQVQRNPNAVAVQQGERRLSYGEVNARANQLARHLVALGVKPDERVAILMERSLEMVVALLATLKAGGAYVPLDPAYPVQRLAFMLQDSAPRAILAQQRIWAGVRERWSAQHVASLSGTPVFDVDSQTPEWSAQSTQDLPVTRTGLTPQHLAYVIYTSGSTGNPKAAEVTQAGMRNVVGWYVEDVGLRHDDAMLLVTSYSFDLTQKNIFGPLVVGASLHLADEPFDPNRIVRQIRRDRISTFNLTPSAFHLLIEADADGALGGVRRVVLGGEPIQVPQLMKVKTPRPEFVNGYGPTECSGVVASFRLGAELGLYAGDSAPLGKPIRNVKLYVLDANLCPVPIGARGEIYIAGVGVGRGYRNQPELTESRFLPDPFSVDSNARMYKSGDVARHLLDGNIEFLGRTDFQVKIRGFRIELGEIEAKLRTCLGVQEAIVLAREDVPGEKRLVAYFTTQSTTSEHVSAQAAADADADALRKQLASQLPDYMVPVAFVALPALPLTPNGKIDRKALPAPDAHAFASREFEAPIGEIESTLARIWSDVLGLERIGRHDNFFDLGGHSLMATQVISRIRRDLGIGPSVRAIFEKPTLEGFAARLRVELNNGVERVTEPVPPKRIAARNVPQPTSFSQRRMWLIQQLNPLTTAYNISISLRLLGPLDTDALLRALRSVAQRHEAFRTRFVAVQGEPMQSIADELEFPVARLDLRDALPEQRDALARHKVSDIVAQPYDLSVAGLHRVALVALGEQEHVLLWTMHHAIGDQWSFGILLRELREAYGVLLNGGEPVLADRGLDYSDYAAWQREQAAAPANQLQLDYWRQRLAGVKPMPLPTDLPRTGPLEGRGGGLQIRLEPALIERLKQFSRGRGVTPFMTLLASFQLLMARFSGQTDIAVAAPIANRLGVHTESLVGTLVNTLVMRCDLSGDPTFADLLKQVQETALQAYANQDTSFEQLAGELESQRDLLRAPLAQVMFNLVNAPFSLNNFPNLRVEAFALDKRAAQFELAIGVDLDVSGEVHLSYASELFTQATATRLLNSFITLVEGVLADPGRRLSEYDLLGTQRAELAQWNQTDRPSSPQRNLAQLLAGQALQCAASTALIDSTSTLTYAQLEARSNQLARALRARGVSRGALVGLCVDRSNAMVVAQLAILKSGAAYVPLDPAYPVERLAMMAADAQLALLVTQSAHVQALKWPRAHSLWLDADAPSIALHDDAALVPEPMLDAGPEDPAYVIYTSGSTGRPKGVAVPHRAVLNFLDSMAREPGLSERDRVLAVTTLSFDIAVLELLLPLSVGATVLLASADQALDGRALRACIEQLGATVMQATPSTWRMLVEAGWPGAPGFKALIGGEALPPDLASALLERVGELWNMYGPTETTVWSTCWRVSRPEAGICIGRPIANTQVHVLDEAGHQCLIGVPGEIFIGGDGVALGYLHRQDLTDERFVPDPFSARPLARLYRTGDLGRWRHDGQLEHMGRLDHQVKIRGHRIELGEIEANLVAHPGVARAVVIVREDRPGDVRIAAYVVPRGAMPAAGELRDHLRATLPQYMLPQHYVSIDAVPLLPNGKLDRSKLPLPGENINEPKPQAASLVTPAERAIAEVWQRLLEIEGIDRNDNFFDLGGHSLLAVRAVSEIEQAIGRHISPRRLIFESLAQLAALPQDAAAEGQTAHRGAPAPTLGAKLVGRFKRLLGSEKQ